jgi:hypothetical protein
MYTDEIVNYFASKEGGISVPTNRSTLAKSYVKVSGFNASLDHSDRA